MIWFNPPFARNIKTNIGKKFISLLRKHFPPGTELYSLFNTKKVKMAYSCCPSMKDIIAGHNRKILQYGRDDTFGIKGCNCIDGEEDCPLQGRCQSRGIVYSGKVRSVEGEKVYVGQTANTFKLRYGVHKSSFLHRSKRTSSGMSGYVWDLRDRGVEPEMEFDIITAAMPRSKGASKCSICNIEKTLIAASDQDQTLNRRKEVMNPCRHHEPLMLTNYYSILRPPEVLDNIDEESDDRRDPDLIETQEVVQTESQSRMVTRSLSRLNKKKEVPGQY